MFARRIAIPELKQTLWPPRASASGKEIARMAAGVGLSRSLMRTMINSRTSVGTLGRRATWPAALPAAQRTALALARPPTTAPAAHALAPCRAARPLSTAAAAASGNGAASSGGDYDYDLFCIGAGSGGVRAARVAAGTYGAPPGRVFNAGPKRRWPLSDPCFQKHGLHIFSFLLPHGAPPALAPLLVVSVVRLCVCIRACPPAHTRRR